MSEVIEVIEVFRIPSRGGPIIVVKVPETNITTGTALTSAEHPYVKLDVIGIDFQSEKFKGKGLISLVVQPDHEELQPGLKLQVSEAPGRP